MYYILSVLVIGVGALLVFSPQTWFYFTESWKSQSADEPSDLYIFSTRFGGIMCMLAGVAYIVVHLFV